MDSNFRSPVRRTAFSRLPVRITRPSCYADERSAEHRTPAGAGELGGRAKEPVSVKGELRGIERGPQKVVSLWVRIHGAALLKPEFSPDAEGARSKERSRRESVVIQTPFSLSPKWIGECADDHLEGAIVCPMQAPSSTPLATARPRARETSR